MGELETKKAYLIRAYHFSNTLKLRDIAKLFEQKPFTESSNKLVYEANKDSYYFVYRFGCIAFFNVDEENQDKIVKNILSLIHDSSSIIISERYYVETSPDSNNSVGFEKAVFNNLALNKVEILALVIAQSTALEFFEGRVDKMLDKSKDIGVLLSKKGRLLHRSRKIRQYIGDCITTKRELVSSLYLLDKPDETWENQTLYSLYQESVDMFEIKERYKTVDYKLRMIQENLELISDLLQNRNANSLEMAIVVLIVLEVLLWIWETFWHK